MTLDVLEVERVAVDQLAVAKRKHLDRGPVGLGSDADHVHRPDGLLVGRLPLGEALDREQPVPAAGRLLVALLGCGVAHLALQLADDRLRVAGEEPDHAVDDRAVRLGVDRADARRLAALDVEVEAGDPRMPPRLRPLARTELEGPVQHVERLAHLLRVRVRAEVDGPPPVPLAREHDPRVLVLHGDGDVGERLVVAEPHVEGRAVALDQVLLQVERFRLRRGDDHLDVAHPLDQAADALPCVARAVEVAAHATAQALRLADVQHLASLPAEEVHAGPDGEPAKPCPNSLIHRS